MGQPANGNWSRLARGAILGVAAVGWVVWFLFISDTRSDDRTPDGRVIVTYWEKWTGFEGDAMKAIVDRFNASQDDVQVNMLTISAIDQKLLLATAGGNPPDLAGVWSYLVPVYADKNALLPLDQPLAAAGIQRADYTPIFWDMCTYQGFTFAMPTTPATILLHWNKALFLEAGLDPDHPPRTIEELDEMADKLTIVELRRDGRDVRVRYTDLTDDEKHAKNFKLIQAGHLPTVPGWYAHMWPYFFGGELIDKDGTVLPATSQNIAALEWYGSHAKKYGVNNVRQFMSSFGSMSSTQEPFIAGKVAMVIQGVWMNNFIQQYSAGMSFGVAPFPAARDAGVPFCVPCESDVIVIPRGARHPREAFAFIAFLQRPENLELLNAAQRKFSPLLHTSESFIEHHANPYIRAFIDAGHTPYAMDEPRIPGWTEVKQEVRVLLERVNSQLVDPETGLRELQQRVQPKLDRSDRRWQRVKEQRLEQWSNDDSFAAP